MIGVRKVTGGDGSDQTSAVLAWLAAHNRLYYADLVLIGEPEYPDSLWLTTWESPLCWPILGWPNAGLFLPASISRTKLKSAVGLEVVNTELTYSPKNRTFTNSTNPSAATSPIQLAQLGYYDNWRVRIWRAVMPTPGDVNTFGAFEAFGGRVASSTIDRGKIVWEVRSWLEAIDQMVPGNVIENTNTRAGYMAANPAPGDTAIAQFTVAAGSTTNLILATAGPPHPGHIYDANDFQFGYLVFNGGAGATLGGLWSPVASNKGISVGEASYNQFQIYDALPWAPTPTLDTFYVSAKPPVDISDASSVSDGDWFPFVPNPQSAV